MTPTQRKAMEMAMEWIEDAVVVLSHTSTAIQGSIGAEAEGVGGCSVKVITALRAALAEQPADQKPVAYVDGDEAHRRILWEPSQAAFDLAVGTKLYTAPQPAKPAEQAPKVQHRHEWFRTGAMEPGQMRCITCGIWGQEAPQPRREVELTDDAITHMAAQSLLYEENPPQSFDAAVRSFARAVIEAYKAKQGEAK